MKSLIKTFPRLLGGLALGSVLFPALSLAVPVKYSACPAVTVHPVKNGSGAFLSEDCKTLYVLPPQKGHLEISGYRPSVNLNLQCERLEKIEEQEKNLAELLALYSKRRLDNEKDIQKMEQDLRDGLIPQGKSVEEVQNEIARKEEQIEKLTNQTFETEEKADERKLRFSRGEGGRGVFLMEMSLSDLVKEYQKENPGLRVMPLPVDQSFISANEQTYDEAVASQMPAVLSLKLIGATQMPLLLNPNLLLLDKKLAPVTAPEGSKIFGGALPGEIRLSSIGACAVNEHLGSPQSFSAEDIKDYIATGVTYSYQVQVRRRHSITYNLKELVRQIHEETKKGGFFSRKTLNRFVDERKSNSWITFHSESEDSRFEYTDEYIKEVKKQFIDRALAQVVAIKTGSPAALLALIDPSGQNGADALGDAVKMCPHLYCQIGAAGLKALSKIFGSETATSELLKNFEGSASETMDEKSMVTEYGTSTFE